MLEYVGIAEVRGPAGFRLPVYSTPAQGQQIGYLVVGGYVPHFRTIDDHRWLEVTLHNGATGWIPYDRDHVTVNLPDPSRVRLCIDPGHGGSDPGAVGQGLVEKSLTFDIAYVRLRSRLARDARIERVWYTRNGDYDVSLKYRWDLANAAFAQLFLSVHINATGDPAVRGTEVYQKCGAEATPWLQAASRRAGCLSYQRLQEQVERLGNPNCPWVGRGVICRLFSQEDPRSYYFVLQNSNIPAVLVECGYLTNPGEAGCLASEGYRDALAQGLYNGISDALFSTQPGEGCEFRTLYGL